jgi:hypothetical protein
LEDFSDSWRILRVFPRGGHTILNIPFTIISMNKTEPDLGVFPLAGDEVVFLIRKGSTHGHSPFFQVSNLKNKVMDAYGDRITRYPENTR